MASSTDSSRPATPSPHLKLLTVGDSGVGKSCILSRYAKDEFTDTFITTIGIDFQVRATTLDGEKVQVQVWDTAGQERFRNITTSYFRGSEGILCVYDITNEISFQAVDGWIESVKEKAEADVKFVLVGNKADLEHERVIKTGEGQQLAAKHGIPFFEVSAKSGKNVDMAFDALVRLVWKGRQNSRRRSNHGIRLSADDGPSAASGKKSCAC